MAKVKSNLNRLVPKTVRCTECDTTCQRTNVYICDGNGLEKPKIKADYTCPGCFNEFHRENLLSKLNPQPTPVRS